MNVLLARVVPRVLQEYNFDHLWDRLPWALLAIGVVLGGFLVMFLLKKLAALVCLPRKYREKFVLTESYSMANGKRELVFRASTRKRWGSVAHLLLETFFFVGIVIVLWVGAHVAGFNFWTSSPRPQQSKIVTYYLFLFLLINFLGISLLLYINKAISSFVLLRISSSSY